MWEGGVEKNGQGLKEVQCGWWRGGRWEINSHLPVVVGVGGRAVEKNGQGLKEVQCRCWRGGVGGKINSQLPVGVGVGGR